jgi:hypothetical protein
MPEIVPLDKTSYYTSAKSATNDLISTLDALEITVDDVKDAAEALQMFKDTLQLCTEVELIDLLESTTEASVRELIADLLKHRLQSAQSERKETDK